MDQDANQHLESYSKSIVIVALYPGECPKPRTVADVHQHSERNSRTETIGPPGPSSAGLGGWLAEATQRT